MIANRNGKNNQFIHPKMGLAYQGVVKTPSLVTWRLVWGLGAGLAGMHRIGFGAWGGSFDKLRMTVQWRGESAVVARPLTLTPSPRRGDGFGWRIVAGGIS